MPLQIEYDPFEDYYSLLDIRPDSISEEIKKAWRKKVFEAHPDIVQNPDAEIQKINAAYSILKDPATRKLYDRKRAWYIAMTFKFKDRRLTTAEIPSMDIEFQDATTLGNKSWASWLKGFIYSITRRHG